MILKRSLLSADNLNNAYLSKTNTAAQSIASTTLTLGGRINVKSGGSFISDNESTGYMRIDPQGNQVILYDGVNNQSLAVFSSSGSENTWLTTVNQPGNQSFGLLDVAGTSVSQLRIATNSNKNVVFGSGFIGVNNYNPLTYLHIGGTNDGSLTTHGLLMLGPVDGVNLTIDGNEILARNNGAASPMYIQNEGGALIINGMNTASYVGIGTQVPTARLDLGQSTGAKFNVYSDGVGVRMGLGIDMQGSYYRELALFSTSDNNSNGRISFGYRRESDGVYVERMALNNSGNLSIGYDSQPTRLNLYHNSTTTLTGTSSFGGIFIRVPNDDTYGGFTVGSPGANDSQGSVLIQSSGLYGTKIHFLTTQSFAEGQKLRWTIDQNGILSSASGVNIVSTLVARAGTATWKNNANLSTTLLASRGNTEDNWVYLDGANPQWGIYHRNIDADLVVAGEKTLPQNSIAYVGGNSLTSYIVLGTGDTWQKGHHDIYGSLWFGNNVTRQHINLYSNTYGIGVQANTMYYRTGGSGFAWFNGGAHNDGEANAGGGGLMMRLTTSHGIIMPDNSNFGITNASLDAWLRVDDGNNNMHLRHGNGSIYHTAGTHFFQNSTGTEVARINTDGIYSQNWIRTYGATGWYNETYAGGWYMQNSTWIENYAQKGVYITRNTAAISNSSYDQGHLQLTTTDGSASVIGFHRSGYTGLALYHNSYADPLQVRLPTGAHFNVGMAGQKTATELQDHTALASGIYTTPDGLRNNDGSFFRGGWWHVLHFRHQGNDGYAGQIAIQLSAGDEGMYYRNASGTTWGSWKKSFAENTVNNVGPNGRLVIPVGADKYAT